jgi:hypothetical protein
VNGRAMVKQYRRVGGRERMYRRVGEGQSLARIAGTSVVRASSASVVGVVVSGVRGSAGSKRPSRNAPYCSMMISTTKSGMPMPFMAPRAWSSVASTHFTGSPSAEEMIAAASSAERSLLRALGGPGVVVGRAGGGVSQNSAPAPSGALARRDGSSEGALDDARAATEKLVDLLLVAAQDRNALAGVEEPRRERPADVGRGRVDDDGHLVTRQHKHVPFMMRVNPACPPTRGSASLLCAYFLFFSLSH